MQICPACHTENNDGTLNCSRCGRLLRERPTDGQPPVQATDEIQSSAGLTGSSLLTPRAEGTLIAGRFICQSLVFFIPQQLVYLVKEAGPSEVRRIWQCSNEACGAIFSEYNPLEKGMKCAICGSALIDEPIELLLSETTDPVPAVLTAIAGMKLAHADVRAPLSVFSEEVDGLARYCLVYPVTDPILAVPARDQALRWIANAARALDDLAEKGITFGGRINESSFGITDGRLVWADFTQAEIQTEPDHPDRTADVRALAQLLAQWLTAHVKSIRDTNLPPELATLLEKGSGQGFANGKELAEAIDSTCSELASPKSFEYRVGRRTDVGRVRELNEDSLFTFEVNRTIVSVSFPICLLAVADGMGGHSAGEVASREIVNQLAAKSASLLAPEVSQPDWNGKRWFEEIVKQVNQAVFDLRTSVGSDMGSTLAAVLAVDKRAFITHVGDSRVYLFNANGWQQLTEDHSLVEKLVASGRVQREDVRIHPQRNVIYRTIGDRTQEDLQIQEIQLVSGDRLLLCSDGLWEMVDEAEMLEIIMDAAHPQEACDRLVEAANAAGGEDNISVVILEYRTLSQ